MKWGGGGLGEGIGRLRHFKSPDDWVRDDGCAPFSYETRATFGFSSSVCVYKVRQKQKQRKKQNKKNKIKPDKAEVTGNCSLC